MTKRNFQRPAFRVHRRQTEDRKRDTPMMVPLLPRRPWRPQPSKAQLRAELAAALANTAKKG